MKKRFIVKKVKIVWRNSMLAGNPIERSFTKFGVFDRNWEHDRWCSCPRPGGEWATNNGQSRKYRIVVDDEAKASRIAAKLNELAASIGCEDGQIEIGLQTSVGVRAYSSYISDNDIDKLIVTKSQRAGI